MNESNNVKFTEDNGKWVWKCYDTNGSVVHRSQLFDTEREAREDYEINGEQYKTPLPETESNAVGTTAPEDDMSNGTAEITKEDQVNAEQAV